MARTDILSGEDKLALLLSCSVKSISQIFIEKFAFSVIIMKNTCFYAKYNKK